MVVSVPPQYTIVRPCGSGRDSVSAISVRLSGELVCWMMFARGGVMASKTRASCLSAGVGDGEQAGYGGVAVKSTRSMEGLLRSWWGGIWKHQRQRRLRWFLGHR